MKTITFRPLRRIKKMDKIVVASYMQWRKMMTADYNRFNLVVDDEYKMFSKDEFVHNHEGELLFFFNYNPADVPIYESNAERIKDDDWIMRLHEGKKPHGILWDLSQHVNYTMPGADCEGVPTFTHWTADYVAREDISNYYGLDAFSPLTVGTVRMWFGWFLYQLNNSYLKIGK